MIRDVLKAFGRNRAALASTFDALDEIRTQIATKSNEIRSLRNAPRPFDEAMVLFDRWADDAATAAIDRLPLRRLLDNHVSAPNLHVDVLRAPGQVTPNSRPDVEMLTGLLFLAGRDKLRTIIAGQLADLIAGRETFDAEQRAERIKQAEADLLHLNLVEEKLIRTMMDSGLAVTRRPDASALALLAADASLPA